MEEIKVSDGWRTRLEGLAGRRHELWVVAFVVLLAVVAGVLLWGRRPAPRIAPPATATAPVVAAEPTPGATTPAGVVLVHVAGAVRRPGLYELAVGARIADAIEAARGARRGAQLDAVNLAEAVVDGQKVQVPGAHASAGAPVAAPASGSAPVGSPTPAAPLVPLNTADQLLFETIPGIGPVTAAAILEYRDQIGSFTSVEQLLEVSGIGPATLESMRPYVTL
jgi:competence protein ComEA